MGNTKIEWATKVWNPVTGCTKISPGCDNCYAERMSKRFAEQWGLPADDPFKVTLHPDRLEEPLRWKKPARIFVCSMGDLFHDDVDYYPIDKVFDTIIKAKQHTFLILTKRPERAKLILTGVTRRNGILPNLWIGVTAENQEQADKRIPVLLQIPAEVRFVSVEPMLGPVDLRPWFPWDSHRKNLAGWEPNPDYRQGLHWVICGGESGTEARPVHPDWIRSLRDQCQAAETPFLFKQWGEWGPCQDNGGLLNANMRYVAIDGTMRQYDFEEMSDLLMAKVGKKKSGRILDGQEWDEYPEVSP